jgi:acyl-coenzyme A synthetase/AMP-(fatty) acid ligase
MSAIRLSHLHAKGREGEHPVAWLEDRLVSWRAYHDRVAALALALQSHHERRWLLACEDPLDFVSGLFALWHAGKVAILPPSLRPGVLESLGGVADGLLDASAFSVTPEPDQPPLPSLDPASTRLELYTSGSTGEPKAIPKSLAQLDNEVMVLEQVWRQRAATTLATVPHHHIYGLLFRLLWPLAGGRPFDTVTCATPEQLLARLEQIGPGIVISSPSQLARMPELIDLGLLRGKATSLFSSGGPLPSAAAARFQDQLGEAPLEIYGSTETGGIAWRQQHNGDDAWTLQPGVVLHLGEDGALTLTSPFLPDAEPLRTGDAAQWLADGRFRLLGRIDRTVKIEEKRLSLPEMESRLITHPWVKEAVTLSLAARRQTVAAVVVLNEAGLTQLGEAGRADISRQLRQHLAHWYDPVLLPRHWRYPQELPYNERSKLAQADLLRLFEDLNDG